MTNKRERTEKWQTDQQEMEAAKAGVSPAAAGGIATPVDAKPAARARAKAADAVVVADGDNSPANVTVCNNLTFAVDSSGHGHLNYRSV